MTYSAHSHQGESGVLLWWRLTDVCAVSPNGTPDKEKHSLKMDCKARKERPSLCAFMRAERDEETEREKIVRQ